MTFPSTLREIWDSAFWYCFNLAMADLPKELAKIGDDAFNDTKIKCVKLPEKLLEIGSGVYEDCFELEKVTISKNITKLPEWLFSNCKSLREIIVPETVTEIGKNAFAEMSPDFRLICKKGSYAEQYARENSIKFRYE